MSRLEDSSKGYRESLETRNLYDPNNEYNLDAGAVADTIKTITGIISPFSSNNLIDIASGPFTKLRTVGLQELMKQFGYTAASNATAEFLPTIQPGNLFDGDPTTKLVMRKVDFQITRRDSQTKLGKILEEVSGFYGKSKYPFKADSSPYNKDGSTVYDFIINSGKGQLQNYYDSINRNIYKNTSQSIRNATSTVEMSIADVSKVIGNGLNPIRKYFPDNSDVFTNVEPANLSMISGEISSRSEYINNYNNSYLGTSTKSERTEEEINSQNYGLNEDINSRIIWGTHNRDGDIEAISPISEYGVERGLLKFTNEIISATENRLIDQTKKKFFDPTNRNRFVGYNGAGLFKVPDDSLPEFNGRDGVRQHTYLDQYNNLAKAIRFNGNEVYKGNENSVIFKSVMPKIHPTFNNGDGGITINNKNLTFSLENLAVKVIPDTDVAYLEDEYSTELPLSEAGPFGGRLMWFPPYDMRLSEQVISRHEATNFIGRSEPIYTYNNSERMATLSFKLLIDYPEQIVGFRGRDDFHKRVSEFFLFGGDAEVKKVNLTEKRKRLIELEIQRDELAPIINLKPPKLPIRSDLDFYFPNDEPKQGTTDGSVSAIISRGYEDGEITKEDPNDFSLNVKYKDKIDEYINDLFSEDYRKFYDIYLKGSSTKLYTGSNGEQYNLDLSDRRIKSIISDLNTRFKKIHKTNKTLEDFGVKFISDAQGSRNSSDENTTAESISTYSAKEERSVVVEFRSNGKTNTKLIEKTIKDKENYNIIISEIQSINKELNEVRKNKDKDTDLFNTYKRTDPIQKGFMGVENDKFQHAFHSQTPEDFHRRLTFLQQCTRQGRAITRNEAEGGVSSKNSVFGRQPVQVLRIGDFFHTKIIIDNINFEYSETTWDLNPEGMGMQPMIADVTIQMRVIGGQSLKGPVNALQNAVSFNYYANSTFKKDGTYATPTKMESIQFSEGKDVKTITTEKNSNENKK